MSILRDSITSTVSQYLDIMDGEAKHCQLYDLFIKEVETPMLKTIMRHVKHNQSEAARILGISRNTLRTKLRDYEIIT